MKSFGSRSFAFAAPRKWNELPVHYVIVFCFQQTPEHFVYLPNMLVTNQMITECLNQSEQLLQ